MEKEIKRWKTHSMKHKVVIVLMVDGVSFSYTETAGITFRATEEYVGQLKERLVSCYGCSLKPIITEY